jgi:hypothetical protein
VLLRPVAEALRNATWRWWPTLDRIILAAIIGAGLVANLAGAARLSFAPYLKIATLEIMAVGLLLTIVGVILERLKLVPKTKSQSEILGEAEPPRPLPEPIPIVENADPRDHGMQDSAAEPERLEPSQTIEAGVIPPELVRGGVSAVWRVARSPRDNPQQRHDA